MSHYVFLVFYLFLSVSVGWEYLFSSSYGDISVNNFNENIWCINTAILGSKWWDGGKEINSVIDASGIFMDLKLLSQLGPTLKA